MQRHRERKSQGAGISPEPPDVTRHGCPFPMSMACHVLHAQRSPRQYGTETMTATMRNDGSFLLSGTLSIFSKCLVQESDGTTSSLPTARGQHRVECLVGQTACALESGSCPCLGDRFSYRG